MQVAELWSLTVGWCGIKGRQGVVCLRVACRSEPFDTVCPVGRSPSAVEVSVPVGIGSTDSGGAKSSWREALHQPLLWFTC